MQFILLGCVVLIEFPLGINSFDGGFINVAYYELSPYIYQNENGSMSGIFPEFLKEIYHWCNIDFKYSLNTMNAKNFSNLIENKTVIDQYKHGNWIWLPLTQDISKETMNTLKLLPLEIMTTVIDVLVHRDHVGPFAKIRIGIFECRYLFLVGLMLSIIFGMLIWFIESWNSSEFTTNNHGILSGIWFALVTMTTVGYGDIAPKSAIGKLLTMAWMVTGVILTAILTSTITNVFGGLNYLEMGGKQILAVEKSLEASMSIEYNSAKIKTVRDYDFLFEGLIKKEYSVGVVDSYVRRNHQNKLEDLRVVKVISDVAIEWIYRYDAYNHMLFRLDNCIRNSKLVQSSFVLNKYRLENEKPNTDIDMIEFFTEPSMLTISILAAAFFAFGLLFEAKLFFAKYIKKNTDFANINEQNTKVLPEFGVCEKRCYLKLQNLATKDDLKSLKDDIASIKATLHLLSNSKN